MRQMPQNSKHDRGLHGPEMDGSWSNYPNKLESIAMKRLKILVLSTAVRWEYPEKSRLVPLHDSVNAFYARKMLARLTD